MNEHLYVIAYDIGDARRGRAIFTLLRGYGEWLQLSVFQCRLSARRHAELIAMLDELIHHREDHILILDLGPADAVAPRVTSLGKEFNAVVREPIIV